MLHYYWAKLSVYICCTVIDGGVKCAMSGLNVHICQILVALLLDRPINDGEVLKSPAVIMELFISPCSSVRLCLTCVDQAHIR